MAAAGDFRMSLADVVFVISRSSLHLWLKIWHRYEVRGAENVPQAGGCLIASNHTSYLDPAAVSCGTRKRRAWFLARDTLYGGRKFFFDAFHCIPLNREHGEVGALRKSVQMLKDGHMLALFPEGTRSLDGKLQPGQSGIGFIAVKAGQPVVPALVQGAFEAYPKGAKWVRPTKVRVTYGKPILPDEFAALGGGRDHYARVSRLIMERIAALGPIPPPPPAAA